MKPLDMMPTDGAAAAPLPRLDDFLCFAVYSAGLAFNRAYKPLLDRYGLTYSQYLLLVALATRDGQTVGELGEQLFLESNTLTPLIKRLEAGGMVSRRRDTRDERVVRVSLTDRGRDVIGNAAECLPTEIGGALGMSMEEAGDLKDRIAAMRDRLFEAGR